MATQPKHVDYGNTETEFQFRFDTSNMKVGDHLKAHFTGDEFIDHVGITSADLFNPTGAEITTNAVAGQFGVSAFHDEDGGVPGPHGKWVRTGNRVPIKGNGLDSEHQMVTMPKAKHSSKLNLRPTADQLESRKKANDRKGITTWAGMDPSNVTAGSFKSKLGDTTKYIIPHSDADNKVNAMYAYMHKNRTKNDFFNGAYKEGKAKMTNLNGKDAYVVTETHFKAMDKVLKDLLQTHSPYKNGLGMSITKLDNIQDDTPLVVSMKFTRQPITESGFVPSADRAVPESTMRKFVNGVADPEDADVVTSDGSALKLHGFEDEVKAMPSKLLETAKDNYSFELVDDEA